MLGLGRRSDPIWDVAPRHHSIVTWERDHVRAAVVELGEGHAELMGVGAAPVNGIRRTSHPDVDRWTSGCSRALTQAEDMTTATFGHKIVPDHVTMAVPAELGHAMSVEVSVERRSPSREISSDELGAALLRGFRKAQDIAGTRGRKATEELIHGSVAEISLDGQVVADPVGLHGGRLDLRMSFCLAPLEWVRALEIVAERLELTLTSFVPHDTVYAAPLPDSAAFLVLLDDHQSVVDMVRRGRVQWTIVADVGERSITLGTARALQLAGFELKAHQADALMRAYRGRQLRREVAGQVAQAFWGELCRWMTSLSGQIRSITNQSRVPNHVYFLDMTRRMPEARLSLETPFWEQCLPFDRVPEITELDVGHVRDVVDCTTQATGAAYLLLRGTAHYVAHLYARGRNLERALARVMSQQR